ncbi:MAG: cell division ATP-binding protein FtsE [Alphaproteobacteria bacterium]
MIRFENVGMRYGIGPEVLRDISFFLDQGSFHFLTGQSGAGKSTLLSLIYLARRPTRGSVEIFGRDMGSAPRDTWPAIRQRIGVVYQDFRLISHLTAFDNVALPLRLAGAGEDRIRRHVTELLEWVGLENQIDALPATLSGGEQQRVAIARAVINRPDLLVADEPTGNVDDQIALRLLYLFEEMNKLGTTILIATHNPMLLRRFPHPRLALRQGELTLAQAPSDAAADGAVAPANPEPG